jgi:DNA mismatch repair protein MutL
VKELIENSLDAGADRISVFVQVPSSSSSTETSAGLFSVQVTDNGSGIDKGDFDLLCERHATSKLRQASDLASVGTFGFRGEALASCAQVARVEVVTKSREAGEEVAWKVNYVNGRMLGDPVAIAGNYGTSVCVKDMFYGHRVRREALLNSTEEYQKIVQTIQAYALNQAGRCAFTLTRKRDRLELQTRATDTAVDVVKGLWNEDLGASLLPFEIPCDAGLGVEGGSCGWASRTTFHKLKSPTVILFLNGRLIEHAVLRRALLQAFAVHLPTSPPAHPFIFVSLNLKGNRVDVNVHPTKRQVFFLDEAEIVQHVVQAVETHVLQRQYETQSFRPIVIERKRYKSGSEASEASEVASKASEVASKASEVASKANGVASTNAVPKISSLYPSQRVLTDHRNHRIDTFLFHSSQAASSSPTSSWKSIERTTKNNPQQENDFNTTNKTVKCTDIEFSSKASVSERQASSVEQDCIEQDKGSIPESIDAQAHIQVLDNNTPLSSSNESASIPPIPLSLALDSILQRESNEQLSLLLKNSLVVGLTDSKWALLQSGTNLLLCDMDRLNFELFLSLLITQNSSHNNNKDDDHFEMKISLSAAFEGDQGVAREGSQLLRENSHFLKENFGIVLSDISEELFLERLPSVLPGQRCPSTAHLETFLQRLCLVPNYDNPEVDTLRLQIFGELAQLYAIIDTESWLDWEDYIKHVLLPMYRDNRARFTMNDAFSQLTAESERESSIIQQQPPPLQIITNTETLYKSFERC